jgi:hypothetical protein
MAIVEPHESAHEDDPSAAIATQIWTFWAEKYVLATR